MRKIWAKVRERRRVNGLLLALACFLATTAAAASTPDLAPAAAGGGADTQALFLSDIHFEPFFDPAKVGQLAAAPASGWKAILAAPASASRQQSFAALQQTCHARGEDTSYALFDSALQAIRKNAAAAKFVTVSGDLISHAFSCKFQAAFPHAAAGEYAAFVEKTIAFVMEQVDGVLPDVPVYWALGNNDSDCGDYLLDAHSSFLAAVGETATRSILVSDRQAAQRTFAAGGYFSARLPMQNARMLVLDDLFLSSKYTTCGGKPDASAADAQIAWLQQQLTQARRDRQKVWVMAHIPPGIDVHASATHMDQVCGDKGPKMFLGSEKIAEVLAANSDVVSLAIFAHTHMDELRLLKPEDGVAGSGPPSGVPVKMVSSISPINGNAPSFTLASVDASSAQLKDFKVYSASNATGVDTAWREEYDWGKTYREPEFSAASLSKLIAGFRADSSAKTEASQAYIKNFYVGSSSLLTLLWPQYACSLENDSAESFKACVCRAAK